MQNDLSCPFHELNDARSLGLISQMIEIQEYIMNNEKSIDWYRNTPYLVFDTQPQGSHHTGAGDKARGKSPRNILLLKESNDTVTTDSILPISYTWERSKFEEQKSPRFRINKEAQSSSKCSRVRGSIMARIRTYVQSSGTSEFWIDKDCIDQKNKTEKQMAIQSMDLIYRFPRHSLALLTTPIRTTFQAKLLSILMLGRWVCQEGPIDHIKLKSHVSRRQAQAMLSLLEHILFDPWWSRAWTYHEELCACTNMAMLLPHYPHVDKRGGYDFGNVRGEIKMRAVDFRMQVTKFCLAHLRKQGSRWQKGCMRCEKVLSVAGQHKLITRFKKSRGHNYAPGALTWHIIEDLKLRHLRNPWEVLAIIANCCGYSVRLDIDRLQKLRCNLSTAVLTLVLLNGEILCNDSNSWLSKDVDLYELLAKLSFRRFGSPVDIKEFKYLKRCRLRKVSLSAAGVLTSGCIWHLHERCRVPPVQFLDDRDINFDKPSLLELEIEQLNILCDHIEGDCPALSRKIRELTRQVPRKERDDSFKLMVVMARNLIRSIQRGEDVTIASVSGERRWWGVFAAAKATRYCFTAWSPRNSLPPLKASRYLEKIVSMEVSVERGAGHVPHLRFRRWVAGLYSFDAVDQRRVLLPWPAAIEQLESGFGT